MIDAEFSRALTLVRKIRNNFAHEISGVDLEHGPEANRVRELAAPFRKYPSFEKARQVIAKSHKGYSADFRAVLGMLVVRLEIATIGTERVVDRACSPIPPGWVVKTP